MYTKRKKKELKKVIRFMRENKKQPIIGKAKIKNFDEFSKWYTENAKEYFATKHIWPDRLYNLQSDKNICFSVSEALEFTYKCDPYDSNYYSSRFLSYLESLHSFLTSYNLSLDILLFYKKDDIDIAFVKSGNNIFIIPSQFLNISLFKDYSNLTPSQILALNNPKSDLNQTGLISNTSVANVSEAQIKGKIEEGKKVEERILKEIEAVENARIGELAELQKEIEEKTRELEAKKANMMAILEQKKAEMEKIMQEMKNKLFMLESEIYSIRCFLGETVEFVKLRSGEDAPIDTPVVLHQKLWYLDEELGKIAGIYNFDFSDQKLFETFLAKNSIALEVFCGPEKCVSLVKVSKTGQTWESHSTIYGDIVENFDKYHGSKIGIIIRNGENVYLGWTDDEKINIKEDMFYVPDTEKVVNPEDAQKASSVEEIVSRYFIFSILQGAMENQKMLSLPHKESFSVPSEYIIYSAADAWLTDNRYGTFADIVDKCNSYIAKGNDVMIMESLSDGHWSSGWGGHTRTFDRDRNYSKRTGDVSAVNGHIYKINLIEEDEYGDKALYISLKKDRGDYVYRGGNYYERQRASYANFRIFDCEFINLTFMNSVWLKYVITNRNLGKSSDRKEGNFAHMILYLNRALEFVREREEKEEKLISACFPDLASVSDWPVLLSEWKIKNKVMTITEWQAKRFAKTIR